MLFNSVEFLIFFPIVVGIYFIIPHTYRWALLLLGSYYFYMSWKAEYILIILISTLIDYISGIQIYNAKTTRKRKLFLGLSLLTNLGLLFSFKYLNFFNDSVRLLLQQFTIKFNPTTINILLPAGISFYTFQTLSYTIDIYNKKIKPQRHLGIFALYVSFFPQLVAGPIERAKKLLPQFSEVHKFKSKRIIQGLQLMLWGFFKKVVVADRLAVIVNIVFNNPQDFSSFSLIIASFFFTFQIYCDFSGYSDIAIGAAKVMGFKLMNNFKRPYLAKSISEFWRRWNISLSFWFRDYVYLPLGGRRVSIPRWGINMVIVFLLSGLWHGANWTFILWGGLHGFYIIIERMIKPLKQKTLLITTLLPIINFFSIIITFLLVSISWIFFRANSISQAFYILKKIVIQLNFNFEQINLGVRLVDFYIALIFISIIIFIDVIQEYLNTTFLLKKMPILQWILNLLILWLIILFGVFDKIQFIYFQF